MVDFKEQRLAQALTHVFEHVADEDAFEGVSLTGFSLSQDRRAVGISWVGPEGDDASAIEAAFERLRSAFEDEAEEILRRRARVRFSQDLGAVKQQRVESILEELRDETQKPGG